MKTVACILVLAGTREARELCSDLAPINGVDVTASLAGVVGRPADYPVPIVSGGFGGADGLAEFLSNNRIDVLVDATHPFAERMTANAVIAASATGVPLIRLERPPWQPCAADNWQEFAKLADAVDALPPDSKVFAPLGASAANERMRRSLTRRPDVEFVLRSIEPMAAGALPENVAACVIGRPGKDSGEEAALIEHHGCTGLLCRNSGGAAGLPKLDAARMLMLPVYLVARPTSIAADAIALVAGDAASVLAWVHGFLASKS